MLDELKIIMETLGTATGAAKQFGIFWLGIELLKVVLGYTLGGIGIFVAAKIIFKFMSTIQTDNSFIKTLRRIINPNDDWGPVIDSEKEEILEAVRLGKESAK